MAKKKAAKKKPERFDNLRVLHCFEQVHEMLIAGFPAPHVAHYIQKRMMEYQSATRATLINYLNDYRKSLGEGEMVHATLPRVFQTAEKRFGNKMQELERLEEMVLMQQYRLDVLHGQERMNQSHDVQVDRMMRELRETLKAMHVIKIDLGLVGSRDLGTITVSAERLGIIREKYGEKAAAAMSDPVSRGRVLAALGAMNKAAGLRDNDGNPMSLSDRMKLSEDESQIVDAEFEVAENETGEESDGAVQDVEAGVQSGEGENEKAMPVTTGRRPEPSNGDDDEDDHEDSESSLPDTPRRPTVEEELPNPKKSKYPEKPPQPAPSQPKEPPGPRKARIKR